MSKVIKYKLNYLFSNRFITVSVILLFLVMNFEALFNSGVLFSGGTDFNADVKYQLLLNNYIIVSSFYGLLLAVYLGASVIGPDMQTGNMYILLSSYPSRCRYFLGTYLAVVLFSSMIQIVLLLNIWLLLLVYEVPCVWTDLLSCFFQNYLNTAVVLSVTGLASIYIKGKGSAIIGLLGYSFFNIYMYNELPFIKTSFIFDITRYKDVLSNVFPITHILAESYSSQEAIHYYRIHPVISNVYIYQIIYIFAVVGLSCLCFKRKEL